MKQSQSEQLKGKLSSSYVRLAASSVVLVPLAGFLGGINLANHNETLARDPRA